MNTQEAWMTYVINLDRSTDRLGRICSQLEHEGLSFERFSAFDGQSLPRNLPYPVDSKQFERSLSPGEIGCALSHITALQQFVETGAAYALLLENDAALEHGFKSHLSEFLRWTTTNGIDFHSANVGYRCRPPFTPLLKSGDYTFGRAHYYPMTSAATLWTANGANKFLRDNPKIMAPIDIQVRHWVGQSGAGFGVRPPLVHRSEFASEISKSDEKRSHHGRSALYRVKNYRRKFMEKWNSLLSWMRHRSRPGISANSAS